VFVLREPVVWVFAIKISCLMTSSSISNKVSVDLIFKEPALRSVRCGSVRRLTLCVPHSLNLDPLSLVHAWNRRKSDRHLSLKNFPAGKQGAGHFY